MGGEWDQGRNKKVSGNKWKWTHNNSKPRRHSKGRPEREVHSDTSLPQEDRKISNNNLALYPKELEIQWIRLEWVEGRK